MVPWGLINAGFNFAICSLVETLIPLSLVIIDLEPGGFTGMTSKLFIVISELVC